MQLYEQIADALVENGYIIIQDALESELISGLCLSINGDSFHLAGISSENTPHIDREKRSDKTQWLDADTPFTIKYLKIMNALREYLNRTLYLGLSYYEAHFSLYEVGDFYEKHLDAFRGSKNRIVTTVFYLNDKWNDTDGGELIIYDTDGITIQTVQPQAGTLVVFLSEKFPHEVKPVKKNRYSIAGWYGVRR